MRRYFHVLSRRFPGVLKSSDKTLHSPNMNPALGVVGTAILIYMAIQALVGGPQVEAALVTGMLLGAGLVRTGGRRR